MAKVSSKRVELLHHQVYHSMHLLQPQLNPAVRFSQSLVQCRRKSRWSEAARSVSLLRGLHWLLSYFEMAAAMVAVKKSLRSDLNEPTARVVEKMPKTAQRLKEGAMWRQVVSAVGTTWVPREVVVTKSHVFLSKIGSEDVIDQIPLHEIIEVVSSASEAVQADTAEERRTKATPWASFRRKPKAASMKDNGESEAPEHDDKPVTMAPDIEDEVDEDDLNRQCIIVIRTVPDGYNSGRATLLRAGSIKEASEWMSFLSELSTAAYKDFHRKPDLGPIGNMQRRCAKIYHSNRVQYFISVVIGASYLCALIGAQILPEQGTEAARSLWILEVLFTTVFTAELLFNLFGAWWKPFVSDVWNWIGD